MIAYFIYYVFRMIGLTLFMVLSLPKQLLQGFYTGLLDTGVVKRDNSVVNLLENLPETIGVRQIFFDSIIELFNTSDFSEDDQPGVTGMPKNRNQTNRNSDSSGHDCKDGECDICDGARPPKSQIKSQKCQEKRGKAKKSGSSVEHLKQLKSWKETISQ